MKGKTTYILMYCIICTVLFAVVLTVGSYNGSIPDYRITLILLVLYCILVAVGSALITVFTGRGSRRQADDSNTPQSVARLLASMRTPVMISDDRGVITWYNEAFADAAEGAAKKDAYITTLCSLSIVKLLEKDGEDGIDCELGNKTYRVYGYGVVKADKSLITTLWFDISAEKQLRTELDNGRTIAANIVIDMADNFLTGLQDRYSDATAAVTKKLSAWAGEHSALLKEYGSGKYIALFDAEQLARMKRDSFKILNEVKEIVFGDDLIPMTLSIGIADTDDSLADKFTLAHNAVEFALQRGGDQVVIKGGAKDVFYGGQYKHDPLLSSLNARILLTQITPLIKKAGCVFIMGHKNADFDCLAACMGIAKICISLEAPVKIVVRENKLISRPYEELLAMNDYKDIFFDFDRDDLNAVEHDSLLFILDVNNPAIFEYPEIINSVSSVVFIDHHRKASSNAIEKAIISYIEPSSSSTSEIVSLMLEQFATTGYLSSTEANILLTGIQLDTNKFTRDCGAGTFAAAQYLRREGADTAEASSYFTVTAEEFSIEQKMKNSLEMYRSKFAFCHGGDSEPADDSSVAARVAEIILTIEGVSASFSVCRLKKLSELGTQVYSISARSDGSVNVQVILERLGGGGHHSNSGAQIWAGKAIPMLTEPLPLLNSSTVCDLIKKSIDLSQFVTA